LYNPWPHLHPIAAIQWKAAPAASQPRRGSRCNPSFRYVCVCCGCYGRVYGWMDGWGGTFKNGDTSPHCRLIDTILMLFFCMCWIWLDPRVGGNGKRRGIFMNEQRTRLHPGVGLEANRKRTSHQSRRTERQVRGWWIIIIMSFQLFNKWKKRK
jgi:hypothetical protein